MRSKSVIDRTPHAKTDHAVAMIVQSRPPFGLWIAVSSIMTRDETQDGSITSAEEFEAVLAAAVDTAINAGIDVRGAWEFQTGASTHDWEVNISELARGDDSDG